MQTVVDPAQSDPVRSFLFFTLSLCSCDVFFWFVYMCVKVNKEILRASAKCERKTSPFVHVCKGEEAPNSAQASLTWAQL